MCFFHITLVSYILFIILLISTVFIAAASSIITTCVAQSLWLKLSPRIVKKSLTVGETHRLAQWSVSPIGRLLYPFGGSSLLLKVAGPLLFATAIVSPVLISGISVSAITTFSEFISHATVKIWDGYLDAANYQYNSGYYSDVPHQVAALAYLSNLTVPSSRACTNSRCSLLAQVGSIQAQYQTTSASTESCPGKLVVIFGAFYLNTVDCLLTLRGLNVTQQGTESSLNVSGSYRQSMTAIYLSAICAIFPIYTVNSNRSPFYFIALSGTGLRFDSPYNTSSSAQQVAQRMQDIFDTATLMAFVRSPGAANVTVTTTNTDPVYVFHPLVLLILLVPALALESGIYMRCRVESTAVCPGYDPI
ncbi:hypothetical protein V8C42DRAFT_350938 [Trichoderma barbatum]